MKYLLKDLVFVLLLIPITYKEYGNVYCYFVTEETPEFSTYDIPITSKSEMIVSLLKHTRKMIYVGKQVTRNPLEDETVCLCKYNLMNARSNEFSDIFKTFWPYNKIERYLKYIEKSYPKHVKLMALGKTYENRTVYSIKIGVEVEGNNVIFVDAGMRGKDWSSIMMALYIIYVLTECEGFDSIGNIDWLIMPVVNPDGYAYSYENPKFRMWNKNRTPCRDKTIVEYCKETEGCGVDIFSNFPYMFLSGSDSSSDDECSHFYPGAEPQSTVETNLTIKMLNYFKKQIILYIGLHSNGSLLLYPYANSKRLENATKLEELAIFGINAINKHVHNASDHYCYGNYANKIAPVSGTALDYVKGQLNVFYAYYFQLRGSYHLHPDDILPVVAEGFYGICSMAREVFENHPPSKGFLRLWHGLRRRRRNSANVIQTFNCRLLILLYIYLSSY